MRVRYSTREVVYTKKASPLPYGEGQHFNIKTKIMKTKLFANSIIVWMIMCSYTSFAQKSQDITRNEKVVREYYAAYEKKDWHMLEMILADGFTFTSPAGDDHINLKLYKERCWPNSVNTKKFDLENVIINGDVAFVCYNGWTNEGKLFRNTERFKLKDGKIEENECFFGAGVNFPNSGK
jgi:ketosteroid isomerase-like protein